VVGGMAVAARENARQRMRARQIAAWYEGAAAGGPPWGPPWGRPPAEARDRAVRPLPMLICESRLFVECP
jgi:hypothetical protein